MHQTPSFILGSGSPRRRDLLAEAGYHFTIEPSPAEELHDTHMDVRELTQINAKLKAQEVAARFPDAVVLGADTLVTIDGHALGKPKDLDEALSMIQRLNGRTHQVMTGVCLMQNSKSRCQTHVEVTEVTFKSLSAQELRDYQLLIQPLDKAGAYAAQHHGEMIIQATQGSWTNVVGLPMSATKTLLAEFSIFPDSVLT
ncbi:MAG: Maf family protein [Verrucomicrobiales bacterium]|nr:Maf family protein [Verrucomicrobiales bacterium]